MIVLLDDGSDKEQEDSSSIPTEFKIPEKRKERSITGSSTVLVCRDGEFITLYVHAIMEEGENTGSE